MRQSPKKDPAPESSGSDYSAISMIIDMADTTWRMFVPIVGLLLIGRYVDSLLGSKPTFMLLGALLGTGAAAMLIKRQLKRDKN